MKPPCEIVVKKILPAIRSILVKDLTKRHELSQTQIAEQLGITQPAVSQYLRSARGASNLVEGLKECGMYSDLKKLSDNIANGNAKKTQIAKEYCEICGSMGKDEIYCVFHAESRPHLSEEECEFFLETKKDNK